MNKAYKIKHNLDHFRSNTDYDIWQVIQNRKEKFKNLFWRLEPYDLMVENFDRNKPTIPQLIQGYKNDSPQEDIKKAISELEGLIGNNYSDSVLEDIFDRFGISLDTKRLGYTNQQFLIEVLNLLKQ